MPALFRSRRRNSSRSSVLSDVRRPLYISNESIQHTSAARRWAVGDQQYFFYLLYLLVARMRRGLSMGSRALCWNIWQRETGNKEQALMNAVAAVCPGTRNLLCLWHINKTSRATARSTFVPPTTESDFSTVWTSSVEQQLRNASTKSKLLSNRPHPVPDHDVAVQQGGTRRRVDQQAPSLREHENFSNGGLPRGSEETHCCLDQRSSLRAD
ncbi:hypothetical protein PybrP1_004856 [[Pythium] brassicae (nom. inval.)]|nr:hypothetical protein PybrP1_004856 [[Pythium] brassicae (nom. inval.)]